MKLRTLLLVTKAILFSTFLFSQEIPLPEHPRPDFERQQWQNINGKWGFKFDAQDIGTEENWQNGSTPFGLEINVPFPWGSELSGLKNEADIGWYRREITVDESWAGKRIFLTVGASDWETTAWLDGKLLGSHRGGYVPFSFELTDLATPGKKQTLIIRVDDARREFTLYGKQGYGDARGIWQTIYIEARGQVYLDALHITPDIDQATATFTAWTSEIAEEDLTLNVRITGGNSPVEKSATVLKGTDKVSFTVNIYHQKLWSLENPHLYEVEATLGDDQVKTYFGMRKISVMNLPGTEFPYIALNNQPVYLQLALDQSYHPEGFYTFPSDDFMREEIERSKAIGLNGIRTHIKVEVPRKLYWADKLGLLVMEDLPNSWGEPEERMRAESEYTLREMIRRDYNHPSIFSWIVFNETWGLISNVEENGRKERKYLPKTQDWVASMYYLAKSLDQSRLVEDNSICCGRGHTETDINSWHQYLPGWKWDDFLKNLVENTYEGSTHHFEEGFSQGNQPNINSECGNVWGYDGSTGDVDWSWDYHRMMNTFRKYPKVAGWLYTEHHDVINEWNGYWRFDRSEKETGMGALMTGMSIRDLHAPVYLSTGNNICETVKGGATISVPLIISAMTGKNYGYSLRISYQLSHTDIAGNTEQGASGSVSFDYRPWMQESLKPLMVPLPSTAGVSVLKLTLQDMEGNVLHRNFTTFEVISEILPENTKVYSVAADDLSATEWSKKRFDVMDGKKINGTGKGYFEYEIPLSGVSFKGAKEAYFLAELSAKELFVKDMEAFNQNQDYMRGSKVAPSSNPNSYPMTDETTFPSTISISVNGEKVMTTTLKDDPADHQGILSWHHQLQDGKLKEAGSYGYLVKVPVSRKLFKTLESAGKATIRLETQGEGGIAVYGKEFGRYAVDPSIIIRY